MRCEYCSFIFSFSGIKGHIKKAHKEIVFPRGVHSTKELESTKIKPVNEFIKSNTIEGEGASGPGSPA